MLEAFVGMFLANFCFIFLKAFQQQNVIHGNWWWVIPTSFGMALGEVFVIDSIVDLGFGVTTVVALGLGGGLGAVTAMYWHRRWNGREM